MTTILTATKRSELEMLAAKAYDATMESHGMHIGFSAAEIETEHGKLECRATPCQSRTSNKDEWFSYRYYLNGRAIAKSKLPQ